MANLLGQNIGTNYKGILNLDTINTPLDATLRAVTDGEGNASPLQLSTDAVSLEGNTSINSIGNTSSSNALTIKNSDGTQLFAVQDNGKLLFGTDSNLMNLEGTNLNTWGIYNTYFNGTRVGIGVNATGSYRLHIKGSGTDATTTSLLVQNSAGTSALTIKDNLSATFGGALTSSSNITTLATVQGGNINAVNILYIGNYQSSLKSNGSGIIQLQNTAENDFSRLQFGGATSSFPSLKRNGTAIDVRLADDSNYALLNAGATFIKGSGTDATTTALLVQNSAGADILKITDDKFVSFSGNVKSLRNYVDLAILYSSGSNTTIVPSALGWNIQYANATSNIQIGRTGFIGSKEASASLQVDATTQGFLPPRMTTTEKNAIATPASGLIVYDSTTNKLACYNGTTWNDLF
jgi:hypothetical protein